jgi:hypothetical protein
MSASHHPCIACDTTNPDGHWWNLRGYYGIRGTFCEDCYEKVGHDSFGNPSLPDQFAALSERLGVRT